MEKLVSIIYNADIWDDYNVQNAMRDLCNYAYKAFRDMPESDEKKEIACQIINNLHADDEYLYDNPHIVYDVDDITEEREEQALELLWDYDRIHCDGCDKIADIFQKILGVELM